MISYGSVCSGIESASVAWEPLGMKPEWFSEVDKFPSAVLAHHWPEVQNLGDMTAIPKRILQGAVTAPDVLVGGTPCQAFSIAGLGESMGDERGQLTLTYVEIANAIDHVRRSAGDKECVIVWENVLGVFSTKDNAFGCFLAALVGESAELKPSGRKWSNAGCVYGPQRSAAWRVLDAQYFGLAQQRKRVFVVASARKGFDPSSVLFESEGVRRDSPPSRECRQEAAGNAGGGASSTGRAIAREVVATLDASFGRLQGASGQDANHGHSHLVVCQYGEVAGTLTARHDSSACADRGMNVIAFPAEMSGTQFAAAKHVSPSLSVGHATAIAFAENSRAELRLEGGDGQRVGAISTGGGKAGQGVPMICRSVALRGRDGGGAAELGGDVAGTIRASQGGGDKPHVLVDYQVRRLTPIECERLQGFPGGHTQIKWGKKEAEECPVGHRYKGVGNSMAVPVMAWIGKRIITEMEKGK